MHPKQSQLRNPLSRIASWLKLHASKYVHPEMKNSQDPSCLTRYETETNRLFRFRVQLECNWRGTIDVSILLCDNAIKIIKTKTVILKKHNRFIIFVAGGRLELPTSGLWILRSNRLSYPAKRGANIMTNQWKNRKNQFFKNTAFNANIRTILPFDRQLIHGQRKISGRTSH